MSKKGRVVQVVVASVFLTSVLVALGYVAWRKKVFSYSSLVGSELYSLASRRPYNGTLSSPGQFYDLLHQTSSSCRKVVALGGSSCNKQPRAQAEICMDQDLSPPPASCIVYTFGHDALFSFEEELLFGQDCEVHIFQPHYMVENPIPIEFGGKDTLHSIGRVNTSSPFIPRAGKSNIVWEAVDTILEAFKPKHPIVNLLKIDLNGAEWEALEHLLGTDLLQRVDQLVVSIHTLHLKGKPHAEWRELLQTYQWLLEGISAAGLQKASYREYSGHMAVVLMEGEDRPRQACGRALFVRRRKGGVKQPVPANS